MDWVSSKIEEVPLVLKKLSNTYSAIGFKSIYTEFGANRTFSYTNILTLLHNLIACFNLKGVDLKKNSKIRV